MGFLGILSPLLFLGGIIFLMYYLPFLAKDSKKITDSTEEIKKSLKIITKQNEEIINLLKYKNNEDE